MKTHLDLFSGIGGFSLGLERTKKIKTVAFCEIDTHAKQILKKHWPNVICHDDVTKIKGIDFGAIDIITGGFPCQDLSTAGKKAGIIAGKRSGLWSEMHRIICEIRPRFAIMENVTGLLIGERGQWMGKLLADLAEIGYNAQWHRISVADIGGCHERKRVWIVAYPNKIRWDDAQEIFDKITLQVSNQRPSRQAMAILASCKQVKLSEILHDHRKDDGLSSAVDRVERLGNTIHPKIAEIIGNVIVDYC